MIVLRYLTGALVALAVVFTGANAHALFHLWTFTEFFSNADGSVQFIELISSGSGENFAAGAQIRTSNGSNVFSFPTNLAGNTFNRHLLVATPGFAMLPGGITPDFTLPHTSFFNPAGDTVRLFHPSLGEFHSRTISSVPTDGVMSRIFPSNTLATNSPTNYSGGSGSVNLTPPASPTGDYNGNGTVDAADYVVWRNTLDQTVSAGGGADGSANGTVDMADYNFWRARFGNMVPGVGNAASVPEPATMVLWLVAIGALATRHSHRARRPA